MLSLSNVFTYGGGVDKKRSSLLHDKVYELRFQVRVDACVIERVFYESADVLLNLRQWFLVENTTSVCFRGVTALEGSRYVVNRATGQEELDITSTKFMGMAEKELDEGRWIAVALVESVNDNNVRTERHGCAWEKVFKKEPELFCDVGGGKSSTFAAANKIDEGSTVAGVVLGDAVCQRR